MGAMIIERKRDGTSCWAVRALSSEEAEAEASFLERMAITAIRERKERDRPD